MTTLDPTESAARDFIEYIVKQIVSHPDDVEVVQTTDDLGVLITLKVNKEDMGKIIGKSGQTAKSLRVLLRMMGSKVDARYNLKIIEPEGDDFGAAPVAAPTEEAPAEESVEEPAVEEAPAEEAEAEATPEVEADDDLM